VSGSIAEHPAWPAALGLLCGVVGFRIGWRSRSRIGLPLIQAVIGGLAFVAAWSAAGPGRAAIAVLAWSIGTSMVAIPAFRADPVATDARVAHAVPYRAEMRAWLATGRGPEATPARTAGRHVAELGAYVIVGIASMNLLSIAMGAVLLNYMNAWVASLLGAARRPWTVRLLAWNAWSVVRVAAYVVIGVAAAWPLASRTAFAVPWSAVRPLAVAGAIGVALDLALKLALSRPCGRALAGAVDLDAIPSGPARAGSEATP
jgi:hypothetical protein